MLPVQTTLRATRYDDDANRESRSSLVGKRCERVRAAVAPWNAKKDAGGLRSRDLSIGAQEALRACSMVGNAIVSGGDCFLFATFALRSPGSSARSARVTQVPGGVTAGGEHVPNEGVVVEVEEQVPVQPTRARHHQLNALGSAQLVHRDLPHKGISMSHKSCALREVVGTRWDTDL